MDAKIAGFIEESHCDEEGRRVIDKFEIEHVSLVPEDEAVDAMKMTGGIQDLVSEDDECCRCGSCDTCPPVNVEFNELSDLAIAGLLAELKLWDGMIDEALEEFEKLVEESEPSTFWDKIRGLASIDDWIDWLMGR